jgi:hypothetical protein
MAQIPFCWGTYRSAAEEIPSDSWNSVVQYFVYNNSPLTWSDDSNPALTQYFFNIHFIIILTQPRRFSKLFFTSGLYAKSNVYTRSRSISHGNYFVWPQYGNGVMEYIRSKERGVYLKMLPSDGICEECTCILRANVFRLAISSFKVCSPTLGGERFDSTLTVLLISVHVTKIWLKTWSFHFVGNELLTGYCTRGSARGGTDLRVRSYR